MKFLAAVGLLFLGCLCHGMPIREEFSGNGNNDDAPQFAVVHDSTTDKLSIVAVSEATASNLSAAAVVAYGVWDDQTDSSGWGTLSVWGSSKASMLLQAKGMGYFEGVQTQKRIFQAKSNLFGYYFEGKAARPSVANWFSQQLQYIRNMTTDPKTDYWKHVAVIMAQFDGLVLGYNEASGAEEKLSELELYIANGAGDLEDLDAVLPKDQGYETNELRAKFPNIDLLDCSALIVKTHSGMVAGHTTWRPYYGLSPRTWKSYGFNSGRPDREWQVSFSSTPGFLSSKDDFYTVKTNVSVLVVMETTNAIFNTSLYDLLTPQSVLTWQRTILANMVARTAQDWTGIFGKYNSGTYNNQWMVLQLLGADETTNRLWILEQIPGFTRSGDVTTRLEKQGYWGSFNIPYFNDIYEMSGYAMMNGSAYSHHSCPRANIFRQRAPAVNNIDDLKFVMQYNDYLHDAFSLGSPLNAISSRYDLVANNPRAFGGIDSKVTSTRLAKNLQSYAINGPTQQQPAFRWSTFSGKAVTHMGQPDEYAFPWTRQGPQWPQQ